VIDRRDIREPREFPFVLCANRCDLAEDDVQVPMTQAELAVDGQSTELIAATAKPGLNSSEGFEK
jgi:GTPase SAR1 family protein